ncbi:alpha-tocopherol transfer protein-like [Macrosteles quadrilineatus]|uniref:alpha-tocopherol transfer protein-like n=1 Tax=Macrosteles quadrilineatus TaxID=74068 RepID=UPI0023E26F77|nr:alpha-tocopherol transfer protein-like [Macrosteles quadrilineatus]
MVIKYDQPPKDVLERHFQELGITESSLRRDVTTLRTWLEKQPHLPDNVADETLEKFLVHSKNSLERAKSKLDQYYCGRVTMADMFSDRDPLDPKIKSIAKVAMYCPCPKPTPEGDRVTIVKTFDHDLNKFDVLASIKIGLMLLDGHMAEENCCKHVVIFDFEGNSMGHAAAFTIPVIKKALSIFLEVLPQRFAGFHVVNAPSYFVNVVNIAKSLLHTKLAQRVHVHGKGAASLLDHIPKDVLPPEYGGTYPAKLDELREMAYQSLVDRRDWFLEQNKIHANLDKRPNQKKSSNEIDHQLHGSFRKIAID